MCGCLSCPPLLGTWPPTQACALTGDGTGAPLVRWPVLNPLSHPSRGCFPTLLYNVFIYWGFSSRLCLILVSPGSCTEWLWVWPVWKQFPQLREWQRGSSDREWPYWLGRLQGQPGGVRREVASGRVQEGFWKLRTATEKTTGLTMGPFVLTPMIPNPDLIPDLTAVSTFPRNSLNQPGTFWSSTSKVIRPLGPLHPIPTFPTPKRRGNLHAKNPCSSLTSTRCPGLKISLSCYILFAFFFCWLCSS